MKINMLVFHVSPQPFNTHIVNPAPFAVHADIDIIILQHLG